MEGDADRVDGIRAVISEDRTAGAGRFGVLHGQCDQGEGGVGVETEDALTATPTDGDRPLDGDIVADLNGALEGDHAGDGEGDGIGAAPGRAGVHRGLVVGGFEGFPQCAVAVYRVAGIVVEGGNGDGSSGRRAGGGGEDEGREEDDEKKDGGCAVEGFGGHGGLLGESVISIVGHKLLVCYES